MKKVLAVLLVVLLAIPVYSSILLTATTETLELTTSSTASTDYLVSYVDITSSTFTPGSSQGNITTATTTTILSAPAASTYRQVKTISVRNKGTASQTVILKKDVSGTEYFLTGNVALAPGETLVADDNGSYSVYGVGGNLKINNSGKIGYNGLAYIFLKTGTALEASGSTYAFAKDAGVPGAWVPGTPGLNGAATDCSSTSGAATMGAPYIQNPSSGNLFLSNIGIYSSATVTLALVDIIWYNTGIVVTTTTAQNITLPTLPNRDLYGSNTGTGWNAALYVTTATTNGSAVTNTTLSYTDSDGNSGNTATIPSFPATAVVGTWVPFYLAAGDRGIQNIASITLGTSYVTGAVSLVLYKVLATVPQSGGTSFINLTDPGVNLYNGTCTWLTVTENGTTAVVVSGNITVLER